MVSDQLAMTIIILVVLFILFKDDLKEVWQCVQEKYKRKPDCKENCQTKERLTEKEMEQLERERIKTDKMYDESTKGSHFMTTSSRTNTTGLITPHNTINSALQMSSDPALKKFETDYADIIRGEIGSDTIESQKAYSKYVKNDNSLRYIDRDIEANYTNSQGISLTRLAPSTKVAATNSTQNISIDEGDYDRTTVSLRKFFEK